MRKVEDVLYSPGIPGGEPTVSDLLCNIEDIENKVTNCNMERIAEMNMRI